ncbi:hypothetical protein M2284_005310 [Rhodococcus sp. LBL1]|uniref:Uncharacterized protein n=1 Tax=Prescottella agglutinans TaxID=1644129 RepID=A0ABT6MKY7_9NOCA|nr:hypothetical protein [Prescottella agglutinans]MDH6284962.1 hypothetical protein [Prescottella agglutinans]MDH6681066.1 hypothetical protein [Rhodococcus sp. LBL1]MDH6683036.1 hypothetical protein [Rhodococcus sp. LBL2]
MVRQNNRSLLRRVAIALAAAATVVTLGLTVAGYHQSSDSTNNSYPQTQMNSSTDQTGLQQTDSFGYIPQHETTFPTNGNGPAPGQFGNGPGNNPGPPLPGGPQLPAAATLTTPAG